MSYSRLSSQDQRELVAKIMVTTFQLQSHVLSFIGLAVPSPAREQNTALPYYELLRCRRQTRAR